MRGEMPGQDLREEQRALREDAEALVDKVHGAVPVPRAGGEWVAEAVDAVEASITKLIDEFRVQPFVPWVEHSRIDAPIVTELGLGMEKNTSGMTWRSSRTARSGTRTCPPVTNAFRASESDGSLHRWHRGSGRASGSRALVDPPWGSPD